MRASLRRWLTEHRDGRAVNTNNIVIPAVTSKVEKNTDVGECLIADRQNAGLLKPSSRIALYL
jgi:hypothetical protein